MTITTHPLPNITEASFPSQQPCEAANAAVTPSQHAHTGSSNRFILKVNSSLETMKELFKMSDHLQSL